MENSFKIKALLINHLFICQDSAIMMGKDTKWESLS